jgi:hypothetical protein
MCFAGVQIFTIPPHQLQVIRCWQRVQDSTLRKGQNIFLFISFMEACKHLCWNDGTPLLNYIVKQGRKMFNNKEVLCGIHEKKTS